MKCNPEPSGEKSLNLVIEMKFKRFLHCGRNDDLSIKSNKYAVISVAAKRLTV
jgi:hypothetical protein